MHFHDNNHHTCRDIYCAAHEDGLLPPEILDCALADARHWDSMVNFFGFLRPKSTFFFEEGNPLAVLNGGVQAELIGEVSKWLSTLPVETPKYLHINSLGGNAICGVTLANLFARDGNVTIVVNGMAYSAAGIMVQGAANRVMHRSSMLGIHRAMLSMTGNAGQLIDTAKRLSVMDKVIVEVFAERTKRDRLHLEELMRNDTMMTGTDALKGGFVDEIVAMDKSPTAKMRLPKGVKEIKSPPVMPTATPAPTAPAPIPATAPALAAKNEDTTEASPETTMETATPTTTEAPAAPVETAAPAETAATPAEAPVTQAETASPAPAPAEVPAPAEEAATIDVPAPASVEGVQPVEAPAEEAAPAEAPVTEEAAPAEEAPAETPAETPVTQEESASPVPSPAEEAAATDAPAPTSVEGVQPVETPVTQEGDASPAEEAAPAESATTTDAPETQAQNQEHLVHRLHFEIGGF